ncbi:hypothetical protein Lnau_2344 [Legionella nautarum]|uniref:Uncharacterized protein n=1 Tax=Legionella nautarum TaxID=45070 RepID=A0A0W0WMQ5_9GAMM|nr:hypothetical protein [Legionella nautarum]KTD33593.1 hypothetical protein Lnau_2344 [Legionella nautarum]
MNNNEISNTLISLSPAKRVKYIRQKLLNQNQQTFCEDGIIREGTLKSIEIERMKIAPKIAERLTHKLGLEGIVCDVNIFLEENNPCHITIDMSKKELTGKSKICLEEMRQKITQLTPINIETDEYAPLIPAQSTLLGREANKDNLSQFNKTLCFIKGNKSSLYYLTFLNENELEAEINNKKLIISGNIIDFCSIFIIELIYLGNHL